MHNRCLINGAPGDSIAITDRGLQFGDGVFETLAVRAGRCEFWDRHLQRLMMGCAALHLPAPPMDLLAEEADRLVRDVRQGVLKIIVTRGSGGRGYRPPQAVVPTRILTLSEWPDYPADWQAAGVAVRLCAQRLGSQPALAGIKHLNRLEQVLARLEWDDADIAEGLLCDPQGRVIEGVSTNLFSVQAGRLRTPSLEHCGVAGIMRAVVMEIARDAGIVCEVAPIDADTLYAADEIFLTNSLIGIWPVRRLEAWQRPPGLVTRRLQAVLDTLQGHR
ncbi:MAG: aminodeoxychorismate lyase [Thiohalobacteraceae bacterium]